jgi:membrane-bound lytic murein transglycosylase D
MLYRKIIIAFTFLACMIFLFMFFNSSTNRSDTDTDYQKAFYKNYRIFALDIPDSIEFAGEKVSSNRFDVRESIDRELLVNTYWQSQTIMLIKKTNRYFPVIVPILKKYNVPEDFKYLAVAESGLSNNLVSPAGAAGMWQFMKETAVKYGLEVNDNVDERYNIEKATEAACKYLLESYSIYKSWTLAAASYNVGVGGLNKQIGLQKTKNYYDLYLNTETARYVYRIIALKRIISDPKSYGFYLRKKDLYPTVPTYTVDVDSSITNMVVFAENHKISYKLLKDFNQWIRKSTLENSAHKSYSITIPKEGFVNYDTLLSGISEEPFVLPDSL